MVTIGVLEMRRKRNFGRGTAGLLIRAWRVTCILLLRTTTPEYDFNNPIDTIGSALGLVMSTDGDIDNYRAMIALIQPDSLSIIAQSKDPITNGEGRLSPKA